MSLRSLRVLAAALVLAVLPVGALAQQAPPDTLDEARQRLDQLEQQEADAQQRVEAARAELDALEPRLRRTSEALDEAQTKADEARREAEAARDRQQRVEERLAEAREKLDATADELASLARDAYMYGPGAAAPMLAAIEQLSEMDSPNEMADVVHMVDVVLGDRVLVIEESQRLIEETALLRREAAKVREAREQEAAEARAAEDEAARRHADMLAVLDQADRAVAIEQQALAEIESQQDRTAAQVDAFEEARRRAAARIGITPAGEGLVSVNGIVVAESLGPQLEKLLEAAAGDGIELGGSGYRSPETTARLRRANGCPDVYNSPPSSCRVPTARPGTSMHEKGLAIDFTWRGQTICYPNPPSRCEGNDAFDWLESNASRYGLYGLSSEAWHWSTNGN